MTDRIASMHEPTQRTKPSKSAQKRTPIKLVIWDLDETYWRGTLSEGPVSFIPVRSAMVHTLNQRGIVNAICSKNTFNDVKQELENANEWQHFVFPSIDWTPKGPRIAQMLREMGLRPINVLFVDDNVGNLREAEHYVPGIQTAEPQDLVDLLDDQALAGKDDSGLTRLAQYRVLQQKASARQEMGGSNEEFLAASDIRVGIHSDTENHVERLLELVNRSNQLNYTKQRFSHSEFAMLLADPAVMSGYVTARDNFGDHGICGFYAHDATSMLNFSFSCRILNMGVESWVYQQLKTLTIEVVGEVATALDASQPITWITQDNGASKPQASATKKTPARNGHVLLKGGCDLSVLVEHLGGDIETEFSFPSPTGALVHQEHTEILKRATPETLEKFGDIIDRIPFLDRAAYQSSIIDEPDRFDTVVYSALMDYTQGLYRYRDTDFVIPFGEYPVDATAPANQGGYTSRLYAIGYTTEFFTWFTENFRFEGMVDAGTVANNIAWLRDQLPKSVQLIIINGAEVLSPSEVELDRHEHHARCNRALDALVLSMPGIQLCDVRAVITSSSDLTNNLRHYSRRSYFELAGLLAGLLQQSNVRSTSRARFIAREMLARGNRKARRAVRMAINLVKRASS
jgi:FkbH-like protein